MFFVKSPAKSPVKTFIFPGSESQSSFLPQTRVQNGKPLILKPTVLNQPAFTLNHFLTQNVVKNPFPKYHMPFRLHFLRYLA
jgi:hypothetical protein